MNNQNFDLKQEYYEMAHSKDPNERCYAALEHQYLEKLKYDECWLVRHTANRELAMIELHERIGYSPNFPGDYPYLDISDAAYEFYKLEWLNTHATFDSCAESICEWALRMEAYLSDDGYTCRFNPHMIKSSFSEQKVLSYEEFCGLEQPGNLGLYHDRDYIAKLLGHNEELLELYEADICDCHEMQNSVDNRLRNAREASEATCRYEREHDKDGPEFACLD